MKKLILVSLVTLLCLTGTGFSAELKPRKPGAGDKCPVCGMFVAKYTEFAAQIQFRDGTAFFFDGPKDLFTYYLALDRNKPGRKAADVAAVFVTSYYSVAPIDGFKAFYVAGSDVNGPMGRELVPFATEAEAREFRKDHKGKAILRFRAITPAVIKGLQ